jgi:hypothetical protein
MNEYKKQEEDFLESKAQPACEAENLTAVCEPIV